MDEIENAILDYYSDNLVYREQAFETCSKFQTIIFFDWNIWNDLSDFSKPKVVRAFAYKTISIIIQNEWEQLSPDSEFFMNFPFYDPETFNNDPIKNLIVNANSFFLLYLSPLETIIQIFDQNDTENLPFISSLLAEFVSCTYEQKILPSERKEIVDQFMFEYLPKYVQTLILHPLSQLKFDSKEYPFFLTQLGKIHRDFVFPENLICSPEVEEFYASFAPLVWFESDNFSIVWIFDSLFSHTEPHNENGTSKTNSSNENSFQSTLEPIVLALATDAPTMFLQNYEELFLQDMEPTERYPDLLRSFIARIPIFFGMLEFLDLETLSPFFEIFNDMLQSSSPTIIHEVSKGVDELIKTISGIPEFIDDSTFINYRMALFETCIKIIATELESLPGAPYDDNYDIGNVRSSIFNLAATISQIDTETVIKELIQIIMEQEGEDLLFLSLIRFLSTSLSSAISPSQAEFERMKSIKEESAVKNDEEQKDSKNCETEDESNETKKEENSIEQQGNLDQSNTTNNQEQQNTKNVIEISDDAKNITTFLLGIILSVSRGTSNYIFTVLTKLIPFIEFSDEELNDFFPELLDLFIKMKPSSFDSFTSYFTSFFSHFSDSGISLPIEQLKSIPPEDPIYYTVATLISKFTGTETMLDSAINDIDCFITDFNPEERESIDYLNRHILQSFDFIAKNPPKSDEFDFGLEILTKIVESNNILINLVNETQYENIQKLISPISHLSNAIVAFAELFPTAMLSLLEDLQHPIFISSCTVVWLKKIALPILTKLYSTQNYENQEEANSALFSVSEYSKLVTSNLIQEIEQISSDSEVPTEIENSAKKSAVILIQLCRFIQSEDEVVQIINVCLKLNDFRCLANIIDISAEKGILFFAQFWNDFVQKRETNCRDKLSEGLYYLYEKEKGDLSQFLHLPDVTQEQIDAVEAKLQICGAARTKRKYIRLLIPP